MSQQGYGGFWIRFLAFLVDTMILVPVLIAISFGAIQYLGPLAIPVIMGAYLAVPLLYYILMHASARQATFGKALLGMVVTTVEGDRISVLRSIARELGRIPSSILMLGYIAAAFTRQKQALHDVIASTTVVRHSSGRVGLGLLIGLFGWVVPVGIVFLVGGGPLLQSMNASLLQSASAMAGVSADSTAIIDSTAVIPSVSEGSARPDSSASGGNTVVQAASNTPPAAAAAATAAAPVASGNRAPAVASNTRTETPRTAEPPAPRTEPAAQPVTRRPPSPQPVTRQPVVSALDPEAATALDQLSPRFATEVALVPARFQDRPVQLYDFGALPRGVDAARVFWPIHGFDASGNPVAIRGQRPIFTTIPRLGGYSGLWQLVYVVTADMAQPNALSDAAAVEAAVRAKRATLRDAELVLNLPVVPRGTALARDTARAQLGWYKGWEVHFFDFGAATLAPLLGFAATSDSAGHPVVLAADSAAEVRNLQIAIVDGTPTPRASSPLRAFADMRTASPPRPTRSPQ